MYSLVLELAVVDLEGVRWLVDLELAVVDLGERKHGRGSPDMGNEAGLVSNLLLRKRAERLSLPARETCEIKWGRASRLARFGCCVVRGRAAP